MAVPGLLFVNSKITNPELTVDLFTRWYENVHIPDIFKTSGLKSAFRYKALDPSEDRPYLALYPVKDIGFLQTAEFKAIPVHDDSVPCSSHLIFDVADFDIRYYKHVETYEGLGGKGTSPGPANLIISCGFTPADEKDYDAWYREEHCNDVSKVTGYRRTRRYKITFARQNRVANGEKKLDDPPTHLTLHEFDGESLQDQELQKAGESEWAKSVMSTMQKSEIKPFKLLKSFGDVNVVF